DRSGVQDACAVCGVPQGRAERTLVLFRTLRRGVSTVTGDIPGRIEALEPPIALYCSLSVFTRKDPHVRLSAGPTEHRVDERAARLAENGRLRSQSRSNQRARRKLAGLRLAAADRGRQRDRVASVGRRYFGQHLRVAECRVSERLCLQVG